MKISLIIPIYNALEDVKLCLDSLIKYFDFETGEIIMVDDYSLDDTREYLEGFSKNNPQFKLYRNDENSGFVKTCNRGMKLANGEILVLLNSDTMICSDFSKYITKCFDSDPEIGVASPIQGQKNMYGIQIPKNSTLEKMNERLRKVHTPTYPVIPYAQGFCFCIRKSVTEKIGYIDEAYGIGYYEEVDFSHRAWENGFKSVLVDDLIVYHKICASFGKNTRKEQMKKNNTIFSERWQKFRKELNGAYQFKNPVKEIQKKLFWQNRLKRFFYSKEYIGNKSVIKVLNIKLSKS